MKKAKILLFDIETFPVLGWVWQIWETNVLKIERDWELASYAYKWLGDSSVKCLSRRDMSEKSLTKEMYKLFKEADILIAHNGDKFDIKKLKTKFIQFNLDPTPLSSSVDTRKIAKSEFGFTSNSLNDLGEFLSVGKKVKTGGIDLWFDCMAGKSAAWDKMIKYNKQDVALLEKVYLKLRPWSKSHPSVAALADKQGCAVCGSQALHKYGLRATTKKVHQRWRCNDCGHYTTTPVKKHV